MWYQFIRYMSLTETKSSRKESSFPAEMALIKSVGAATRQSPRCLENTWPCSAGTPTGFEVNFRVHLQSFASNIFSHQQTGETTSKLFRFVWETWIILTRKRLLVDIFLTRRLSKSLAFCEFASVFRVMTKIRMRSDKRNWLLKVNYLLERSSRISTAGNEP